MAEIRKHVICSYASRDRYFQMHLNMIGVQIEAALDMLSICYKFI